VILSPHTGCAPAPITEAEAETHAEAGGGGGPAEGSTGLMAAIKAATRPAASTTVQAPAGAEEGREGVGGGGGGGGGVEGLLPRSAELGADEPPGVHAQQHGAVGRVEDLAVLGEGFYRE